MQVFGLDKEGIEVDFDEGQLLRADIMTRYNAARLGVLTGILTPNEVRRSEGLPPMEGGDKLMVPANTAALGSDMTGTAPDGAGGRKAALCRSRVWRRAVIPIRSLIRRANFNSLEKNS